jgi:hypothetical protein
MFMPPDQLGLWAPLFAPVNPQNAISQGFEAAPKAAGKAEPEKLPGQHAGLDELAVERGHVWSRDDLTVAEKQAELGGD